jgi:hypothetical protein
VAAARDPVGVAVDPGGVRAADGADEIVGLVLDGGCDGVTAQPARAIPSRATSPTWARYVLVT